MARHALRIVALLAALSVPAAFPSAARGADPAASPKRTPAAQADNVSAAGKGAAGAPVVIFGRTLFEVREKVFSYAPEERARNVSARVRQLMRDPLFRPEQLATVETGESTDIVAGDFMVMAVTDRDAAAEGMERQKLAGLWAERIRDLVERRRYETSLRGILEGALYTGIATVVLIVAILLLNRGYRRARGLVDSWRGTKIRAIRIQKVEFLSADRIAELILGALRILRIVLIAWLVYLYLPLVFRFFPWTRPIGQTILDFTLAPLRTVASAVYHYLPNLFFIGVIVLITRYVNRFVRYFFLEVERGRISIPRFYPDWAEPTAKIARFLVVAFAAVVLFPYLPGADSPAFKGVSIFLGVLFSLGSSSAVANIVAGVFLTYMRAFRLGDRVRVGETTGDVMEKTLLVTRIRTIKNEDVSIPNAQMLAGSVTNYSSCAEDLGLILHTSVTIGYDAPWKTVHELLAAAARSTTGILSDPPPFVWQTALNDFYVTYEINAYTREPNRMMAIYADLHRNIQDRFNEAGVEIMSPHYAQLRDGNRTTIPADYRPPGYVPGGIRVERAEPGGGGRPAAPRAAPKEGEGPGETGPGEEA